MIKRGPVKQNPCYQVKVVDCGQNEFIILNDQIIGEGASAIVKKALNRQTGEQFAVKIIKVAQKDSRDTALKELQIAQQLPPSPNLVQIQKIRVESQNNIYIFMQYCDGGTLIDQMKSRHRLFKQQQVYRIFCHLINGYKVLFDSKVMHQDLKPQNILIKDSIYKIADFGLAIFSQNYKYTSKRKGTLYYMAFEKITRREYTANVKSDVYSMGVMLFEVITGRHPYIEKRGLKIKEYAEELKEARVRHENITERYSFKLMKLYEVVVRMVEKSEEKRIGWEEVYQFYQMYEPLEPFKQIIPVKQQMNPFSYKNATFKEVDRSQAAIEGLQLEIQERDQLCESISEKNPHGAIMDNEHTQQLRLQLTDRRNFAYFLSKVIKSVEIYIVNRKNELLETLLLALYLYRPKILPFLEEYDPFESIQAARQLIEVYEQDSKFVKQEQICHLGESQLSQTIKKEFIAKFKGQLSQAEQFLSNLIKTVMANEFLVIRINSRRECVLILYLLSLQKILNKNIQKIEAQFDKVYKLEDDPTLSKNIQDLTMPMMVMYDPEREQDTEEFEVLDWADYVKDGNESESEQL